MRSGEFQMPEIIDVVLYHKSTYNYIRYNLPIQPHKTRRSSHPPFLKYALDNLGVRTKQWPLRSPEL